MKLNVNTICKVKLTPSGVERLKNDKSSYFFILNEKGELEIELWHLMRLFGPMFYQSNNSDLPFKNNIIDIPEMSMTEESYNKWMDDMENGND